MRRVTGPCGDPTSLPATYVDAAPPLGRPALHGARRVDCAIVGGGFTGLSAALHLAEAGCDVALLEAREIGWGGSGRAFGQVVPYAKHDETAVLRRFGAARGERILRVLAGGPDLVFRLIAAHGIACEAAPSGLIVAAHSRRAEAALAARAAYWQARGADVAMLCDGALAAETGTRFYRAALRDRRGGTVNPLGFARGLARAALAAGAAIFERSPAVALDRCDGWRVTTPDGELAARQVVLATDAYTDGLWPGLSASILPLRAYQLISAPLSDNLRRLVLPGGQPLTDTRRLYSGIRLRADGRLHLSVPGPAFDAGGQPNAAAATRRVRALFPDLPPPRWEGAVAGWVGMSADQYPHIHRLAPGLFAGIGLSGRGIAFGTLLGADLAGRVLGRPAADWLLPDSDLRPLRARRLARPLAGALLACYRARDMLDLAVTQWAGGDIRA